MIAPLILHATCVAWEERGVLILGPSGIGKSALALELLALGCTLVADDRTEVREEEGRLVARCPAAIRGLIEARGVGLLTAATTEAVTIDLAVDLGRTESERLPSWHEIEVAGVTVPCLHDPKPRRTDTARHHFADTGHFAAAIRQYLKGGRNFPVPPEAPMRDVAPDLIFDSDLVPINPSPADAAGARRVCASEAAEALPRVVLVTGPSGAGRTTAIRALEDLGFEVIDNLPLSFLPRLVEGPVTRPLALGLDVRNRDFGTDALIEAIDRLAARPDIRAHVLYLDAEEDVLQRRYSETRRRHPLSPDGPPAHGIARERALLIPIRARADILIDTGSLTPHDLRAEVESWFAPQGGRHLSLSIESFSYKRGLPRGLDIVLDCRFLRNPHWEEGLRARDGRDPAVAAFVEADERFADFFTRVRDLTLSLLPAYREEGKAHLSIGFGCTGGQHRSVTLAESLAKALAEAGWQVSKRHRELERRAEAAGMASAGATTLSESSGTTT